MGQFLVDVMGFNTAEEGLALRAEYFSQYHSTVKALTMADKDGRLPKGTHYVRGSLGE